MDSIPMLVGQIFGSFVPFIDVRDVVGNLVNDDPEMAMFSMIGLIPAGQDAVKAIAKFTDFALRHAFEVMLPAELLIQISNKSDNIAKMIGRSDEAKSVKVAMAGASGEGLTRPMAEQLNDIIPDEKIKFNPKASLMDEAAETSARAQRAVTPSLPKGSSITCYWDK